MGNSSFEKRLNDIEDQIGELSERLDRISRALYFCVKYDAEYDCKIHEEIERICNESEQKC